MMIDNETYWATMPREQLAMIFKTSHHMRGVSNIWYQIFEKASEEVILRMRAQTPRSDKNN